MNFICFNNVIKFYNIVCVYKYIRCEESLAAVRCRFYSSVRMYKIVKINGRHHAIYCFYSIMRVCAPLVMRLMRVRCDI